jgi:hypothetical protein
LIVLHIFFWMNIETVSSEGQIPPPFSQFENRECLGGGGMGMADRTRHKSSNRLVALKPLVSVAIVALTRAGFHETHRTARIRNQNLVEQTVFAVLVFLYSIPGRSRPFAHVILVVSLLIFPSGLGVSVARENLSACPATANNATNNTLPSREERWKQDLEYFQTELPQRHKDFSKLVVLGDFDRAVAGLKQNVTNLTDAEIVIGLMRIVAGFGVVHTTLDWRPLAGRFHTYPIQMRWLDDGLVVLATIPDYREALGARVVKMGAFTPKQLEIAVAAYIPHENTAWLRQQSPAYLGIAELLKHLHVAGPDGSVEYSLIKDGKALYVARPTCQMEPPPHKLGHALDGAEDHAAFEQSASGGILLSGIFARFANALPPIQQVRGCARPSIFRLCQRGGGLRGFQLSNTGGD